MTDVRISSFRALISDQAGITRLLQNVPDAQEIGTELVQPCFTWRCQAEAQRSYWIASDGVTALCLTVVGLNLDEVIAVWLAVDERRAQPGFALGAQVLRAILCEELALAVDVVAADEG
ncbi:MAG: hypothetical protein ACP5P4_03885 [Steroidobacteraceae bacterium]